MFFLNVLDIGSSLKSLSSPFFYEFLKQPNLYNPQIINKISTNKQANELPVYPELLVVAVPLLF